ncbi:MAG: MBL fold metallo-hydrolase [Cyclobacteriaceae bacterium]|nr:MBL fold metallo-hydrolase [Cyclobacteriaceae bacterium]
MDVKIKFLGAARSVTGSKYLLEIDSQKILLDCGLFQGQKELRLRNWDALPIDPATIDVVVLTHAHIDHIGYLPRLVKDGFSGKIICTPATEDLLKIMLMDAAKLQEEEAMFAFKRGYSKHEKPQPLFTTDDAKLVLLLSESHPLKTKISLSQNVSVVFHNSGHILGSAFAEFHLQGTRELKKILFSGDLGRYEDPIMFAPDAPSDPDVLIVESTYGNRLNPQVDVEEQLTKIVNEACDHNGALVIPAFALGRTQSLIYYLTKLMDAKAIPLLPIYIDSPMAINVTDLYERHAGIHKIKVIREGSQLISIFDSHQIHFCYTREGSKALNEIKKPVIIISASGMATGGRILHHLSHRLPRTTDTVLFAGYQAEGSRGRRILEGEKTIRIFGEEIPVNCHVREVHGLSAHADQTELMHWLSFIKKAPKLTFITHGEIESATTFSQMIEEKLGWKTIIPEYLQTVNLFDGI